MSHNQDSVQERTLAVREAIQEEIDTLLYVILADQPLKGTLHSEVFGMCAKLSTMRDILDRLIKYDYVRVDVFSSSGIGTLETGLNLIRDFRAQQRWSIYSMHIGRLIELLMLVEQEGFAEFGGTER